MRKIRIAIQFPSLQVSFDRHTRCRTQSGPGLLPAHKDPRRNALISYRLSGGQTLLQIRIGLVSPYSFVRTHLFSAIRRPFVTLPPTFSSLSETPGLSFACLGGLGNGGWRGALRVAQRQAPLRG